MKIILFALALMLVLSAASAGFIHAGWSAPVYRRVVYAPVRYSSGWPTSYGHGGWSGSSGWSGSNGWSGSRGWSGWSKGWW